ncbi:unnamed protein product [Lactuca saligna]|uniref:F-box/LRR-repeat protein 15-like leucin rich repeat domain-containing protein n=1 Tax=Lactuca saligna TaxID=75948 RepID=A0AA35YXS1_LACSI|nr:unnamed protein product [Lactuca saligna]
MESEPGRAKDSNGFFFPVTSSRNAKWWYSAFHNVTDMTEAQGCAIIEVLSREKHNELLVALYSYISSQGSSLVSVDLSSSDVTDSGLLRIKECKNVEALNLNFCEHISDVGLECIIGLSNLTSLSLKRNTNITAKGLSVLSGLVNLSKLDLERCSEKGLSACGHLGHVGLVEQGLYYMYELMKQKGVKPGLNHYMCIINMLIKAGQLNESLSFIVSTPSKWDVFAWTALLSACRLSRVIHLKQMAIVR